MPSNTTSERRTPVFKADQPDDSYKFRTLPPPSGKYPYRLNITDVVNVSNTSKMVFHMAGDTGSVQGPAVQELLVKEMSRQFEKPEKPLFLYHLGDVVYKYGEAANYYEQFFKPFEIYLAPVFAIPGNHDGDINPDLDPYTSLEAFTKVFCSNHPEDVSFSNNSSRKSNIQPNVYWTLQTPLANFIGLYGNVPKFGLITEEQKIWFIDELKTAAQEKPHKALIVCLHHAPYSADTNHGSSRNMIEFLDSAFEMAEVKPDVVFSGHVHNYQRFIKTYHDGSEIQFVVSGAGGYHELHNLAPLNSIDFPDNSELFKNVRLEKAIVGRHGFLKITLEKKPLGVSVNGEYFVLPDDEKYNTPTPAMLFDEFNVPSIGD